MIQPRVLQGQNEMWKRIISHHEAQTKERTLWIGYSQNNRYDGKAWIWGRMHGSILWQELIHQFIDIGDHWQVWCQLYGQIPALHLKEHGAEDWETEWDITSTTWAPVEYSRDMGIWLYAQSLGKDVLLQWGFVLCPWLRHDLLSQWSSLNQYCFDVFLFP